jgi:hypothetical protein
VPVRTCTLQGDAQCGSGGTTHGVSC